MKKFPSRKQQKERIKRKLKKVVTLASYMNMEGSLVTEFRDSQSKELYGVFRYKGSVGPFSLKVIEGDMEMFWDDIADMPLVEVGKNPCHLLWYDEKKRNECQLSKRMGRTIWVGLQKMGFEKLS